MSGAKQNHKKTHREADNSGLSALFLNSFKSATLSLVISLLISALLSFALLLLSDPLGLIAPCALCALYFSSFLSGLFCMRRMREGILPCGILAGGIFMLFYMLISLFMPNELSSNYSFVTSLLLHILILAFSIIGAYAAKSGFNKKRRIKR